MSSLARSSLTGRTVTSIAREAWVRSGAAALILQKWSEELGLSVVARYRTALLDEVRLGGERAQSAELLLEQGPFRVEFEESIGRAMVSVEHPLYSCKRCDAVALSPGPAFPGSMIYQSPEGWSYARDGEGVFHLCADCKEG